jgi:hypothetical protein
LEGELSEMVYMQAGVSTVMEPQECVQLKEMTQNYATVEKRFFGYVHTGNKRGGV